MGRALERRGLRERIPWLISAVAYWVVLLFFGAAAIERLELPALTTLVGGIASYLPRVLLGLLIIFASLLGGNIACTAITAAAIPARLLKNAI